MSRPSKAANDAPPCAMNCSPSQSSPERSGSSRSAEPGRLTIMQRGQACARRLLVRHGYSQWRETWPALPIRPRMLCASGGPAGSHRRPPATGSARSGGVGASGAVRSAGRRADTRRGEGLGSLRHEGEGFGVTQVSSGVLGDGRTVPGTVRRCPGPHPYPSVPLENKYTTDRRLSRGCRPHFFRPDSRLTSVSDRASRMCAAARRRRGSRIGRGRTGAAGGTAGERRAGTCRRRDGGLRW